VTSNEMLRIGFQINLIGVVVITLMTLVV
jgi:hypothetical protein